MKRSTKRAETQRAQREAGPHVHPRELARAIAGKAWRDVPKGPKTGQKYLHPERHRKGAQP